MDILTLVHRTDTLSREFGNKLLIDAAQCPRRSKIYIAV